MKTFLTTMAVLGALFGAAHAQFWGFEVRGAIMNSTGYSNMVIPLGTDVTYYYEIDPAAQSIPLPAFLTGPNTSLPTNITFYPVRGAEIYVQGLPPMLPIQSAHYVANNGQVPGLLPTLDLAGVASQFSNGEAGTFEIYVTAASTEQDFITEVGPNTMVTAMQTYENEGFLPFIDIEASPGSNTIFGSCTGTPSTGFTWPCSVEIEPVSSGMVYLP